MNFADKRKVLFAMPSMFGGGAQRVTTILLKYLDRERFDLSLVLIREKGEFLEHVPCDIEILDLNCDHVRGSVLNVVRLIWQKRPDVVFSLHMDLNSLLAALRPLMPRNVRLIARLSNLPSMFNKHNKYRFVLWIIYRIFYNKLDTIICQSKDMKKDLFKYAGIGGKKITIINNPVNFEYIENQLSEAKVCLPPEKINVLATGKLTHQKGFDLLLQAFAKISDPSFHLTILGKGPDDANLKRKANRLGITKRVTFAGFQSNPFMYMKQADLFVLSSRFEGFPNVAVEANACGTPVIAFECPGGINEIIEDGINGWKVTPQDPGAMANAIEKAAMVRLNPKQIKEYISSKFSLKEIVARYEEILMGSDDV